MSRRRDEAIDGALLWAAMGAFAAGFASLASLRHLGFDSGRFDLGNMVQAVWATAHGDPLQVTDLSGEQVLRLGSHVDPLLVLLAPFWWLWPSPHMLLAVQAAGVALGALPVYWLARTHLRSERAALIFGLAYLLSPPVQWLTLDDFHPVALTCPLILFAFWYLDRDRLVPFALFAGLAIISREEIGLVVAAMGVWYALARGRRWVGTAIGVVGVAWSAFAIGVVMPWFGEGADSRFASRYQEVGGSLGGIVETAVLHPGRLLSVMFDSEGLTYLAQLLLPLLGLALLAPLALAVAIPGLAINLLSSTSTQTSIHFHYTAGIMPALFVAAVLGAGRLTGRRPELLRPLTTGVLVASLAWTYFLGAIPLTRHFPGGESRLAEASRISAHDRVTARAVELIPEGAVVSTSNAMGAHLSERRRILSFGHIQDADWVAVDESRPSYFDRFDPGAHARRVALLRENPGWRVVFEEDGVLVFRRVGGGG